MNKKELEQEILSLENEVKKTENSFKEMKQTIKEENTQTKQTQDLIKQYKVTLVPTMIFKKSNGQTMTKIEGAMSNNEFEQYLKRLLNE